MSAISLTRGTGSSRGPSLRLKGGSAQDDIWDLDRRFDGDRLLKFVRDAMSGGFLDGTRLNACYDPV